MQHKKQKNTKRKTTSSTSTFIIIATLVIILGLASFWFFTRHRTDKVTTTADGQGINLKPATRTEKEEADAHKDQIVKNDQAQTNLPTTPASQKKQVPVVITEISDKGVRSYVTGVFEEGGTCTAVANKGDSSFTKFSMGFENASYTQCAPINWDSPLNKGTWTITVTYKSASAEGSQTKILEVK